MRQFFATVFYIQPLVLNASHEISDLYWTRKLKDKLCHSDALEMIGLDNLIGGDVVRRAVVEDMATLDPENQTFDVEIFMYYSVINTTSCVMNFGPCRSSRIDDRPDECPKKTTPPHTVLQVGL